MAGLFKDNLVEKMKTDPVMNQVFQNPNEILVNYTAFTNASRKYQRKNDGSMGWVYYADDPNDGTRYTNIPYSEAWPVISGKTFAEGNYYGKQVLKRRDNITFQYTKNEDGLYWENMIPNELYNVKLVDDPENPLLNNIRNQKIKVTNTFQSFSK